MLNSKNNLPLQTNKLKIKLKQVIKKEKLFKNDLLKKKKEFSTSNKKSTILKKKKL